MVQKRTTGGFRRDFEGDPANTHSWLNMYERSRRLGSPNQSPRQGSRAAKTMVLERGAFLELRASTTSRGFAYTGWAESGNRLLVVGGSPRPSDCRETMAGLGGPCMVCRHETAVISVKARGTRSESAEANEICSFRGKGLKITACETIKTPSDTRVAE